MRNTLLLTLGFAALGTIFVAQAGPPLICHPYNIGGAKSLPWGSGSGWDNPDPSYNVKNLATDTLAILDQPTPVLVRMETLRRAALYGSLDHDAARVLLAQLKARETASEKSAKPAASALFDYGYFLSSLKQIEWKYKEDLSGGVDGYAFVQKALAIDPNSSEMHFAAAIMASSPPRPTDREEHLRKARAARNDALLAQNLSSHFQ
ncbi:MAG TPA: hypothetical protein VEU96_20625 [Bryobacteraceae bacterium]|nr:hypothetical protein [Bryobacteraceae bacterium]